jgi:hypothetical protein
MEQNPPIEANSYSASEEIPTFYETQRFITVVASVHSKGILEVILQSYNKQPAHSIK